MAEPVFLAQAENPETMEARIDWLNACNEEAEQKGVTFARASICPEGTWPHLNLILYEGWTERPTDQGEPRWQLVENKEGKPNDHT